MPASATLSKLVRPRRRRGPDCSDNAQRSRPERSSHPQMALAIILGSYLMVVLDLSVIITALPKIHQALHFSPAGLSWVQSAYALTFGGLLLLGARAGDILGRRRVFIAGIGLFSLTSLLGGLAQSAEWLLAARALQGVAAAIAAPSTLALLTSSFPEGPERTRAVAAYAAVAGGGSSVGLVLGGMLTQWISWRWGLFVNVPVGLVLMSLAPRYLIETERHPGRFDLLGAATSTIGMTALVYGFVRAASDGWGDPVTVASFVTAVVLMAAFVVLERRAEQPITPLRLFASRQRSGAYLARLLVVGAMLSMFFFVTQYLQGARNFTALEAGLAFLPMTLVLFAMVRVVPRLVARVGDTPLLVGGLFVALAGMAWLSQVSIGSAYFPQIALPLVLLGLGMGMAFTPLTTAGIAGVDPADAGAASGLINAAQQLGGSLGLSVLVTVFASATRSSLAHPPAGVSGATAARDALAHAVASSVAGSAILLALALLTAAVTVLPARTRAAAIVAESA